MKKAIIAGIISLPIIVFIAFCIGLFFLAYDYKSVLIVPEDKERHIKMADSLSVYYYSCIESQKDIEAYIVFFETGKDSIVFTKFNVKITSADNPDQVIELKDARLYQNDTITPVYLDSMLWDNFSYFTEGRSRQKTLRPLPCYRIKFDFETRNVDNSRYYNLIITGTALYKGKTINLEKTIRMRRKKAFVPYQMMT